MESCAAGNICKYCLLDYESEANIGYFLADQYGKTKNKLGGVR